jgi:hypothetical protein
MTLPEKAGLLFRIMIDIGVGGRLPTPTRTTACCPPRT